MIDDERLREALEARAGDGRIDLADRARAVATDRPRSRAATRWRMGGLGQGLAVGLSALVVVVAVAGALGLRSPAPDPAAGPSGSPGPAASGSPVPSAPSTTGPTVPPVEPIEPWGALTWFAGDVDSFEDTEANTYLQSALWWRDRWFAVGYRFDLASKHVSGHVWTSPDGRSWSRADSWPDIQFDRIVGTADRLTIVGAHREADVGDTQGPTRASMWISTDGAEWTEAPFPAHDSEYWAVSSAAVGGHGWLVRTFDIDGRERWLAGDPVDGWRDIVIDPAAFADGQVNDVIATADGWMTFGMTGVDKALVETLGAFGDPSNDRGAIWSSLDGEHWTAAEIERPGTSVTAIVAAGDGWIATGTDHGGCPRCVGSSRRLLWRSDDGHRWSPIELDQVDEAFASMRVESDGRRAAAFDHDDEGRLRLRETVDGVTWSNVEVFVEAPVAQPAMLGGLIAVGPDSVLTFVDPSTSSLPYFWMVPQVGVAGPPPPGAATQPPAPVSSEHDVPCEPTPDPCGP